MPLLRTAWRKTATKRCQVSNVLAVTAITRGPVRPIHTSPPQFALIFVPLIARLFCCFRVASNVHFIATRRTLRHTRETLMDLLTAFFAFNLTGTLAVLVAFCFMGDSAVGSPSSIGKRFADFNFAGAMGAATSMVLLASVATLFR